MVLEDVFVVVVALEDVVVVTKSEKRVGSGSCSWKECLELLCSQEDILTVTVVPKDCLGG